MPLCGCRVKQVAQKPSRRRYTGNYRESVKLQTPFAVAQCQLHWAELMLGNYRHRPMTDSNTCKRYDHRVNPAFIDGTGKLPASSAVMYYVPCCEMYSLGRELSALSATEDRLIF